MTLRQLPGEGATLEWAIEGAEILSGQGTRTVTFRPVAAGDFLAKVTARYPDGACETFDQSAIMFRTTGEVADFTVTPSTIKKGEKAVLTFTRNMNIDAWSVGTSPERQKDLSLEPLCQSAVCSFEFTDTVGEGTVQFELQYSGPCFVGGYKSAFTTLTITP